MNKKAKKIITRARAIIFDVDGLLIDSEPIWQEAVLSFFEKHRIPYNPAIVAQTMGMGVKDGIELFIKELGLQGSVEELAEEYRTIFYKFLSNKNDNLLTEGARELVELLAGEKRLAIATGGHTQKKMKNMLRVLHLDRYFDVIVSSDQVARGKPAPDVFLFTINELGVDAKDCVFLEDSRNGIIAARSAGIPVIGVNKNPLLYQNLVEAHADIVLLSLKEIL